MGSAEDLARLEGVIGRYPSVLIAFSGGVDSSVVAAAAYRRLGNRAQAITLRGPSLPSRDARMAEQVASKIGMPHRVLAIDQLTSSEYAANPINRCYFCRAMEGELLQGLATQLGVAAVLDGVHRDDMREDRPGLRAMDERSVRHPLLEAGLGKGEVRAIARDLGLPNHDTPSDSCLASRVAQGQRIDGATLARVDRAEEFLAELGFTDIRVRVQGGDARVVVGADEVPRLASAETWEHVREKLISLGFSSVIMDPTGRGAAAGRRP